MTPERLELFVPERNPLHYLFAGAALMGFLTIPAQVIEQTVAPEPAPVLRQAEPFAPLWSKKCEAKEMDAVYHQSDGGQWTVHCIPKTVIRI